MKSVLIVTPYFAPQSHAAVFRAHKLAKYLPEHGWKPYVLTVGTNYLYNEDPGLLDELPKEVEIVRTRYVEPTLRGVRMALGGRDRSFEAEKASLLSGAKAATTSVEPAGLRRLAGNAYAHARRNWLQSPDAYWPWERSAIRAGRELIDRHGIDLVYTTTLPYTTLRIGDALQRETGAKWVADFRDPATYGAKFSGPSERVRVAQHDTVRRALARADAVTTLSSTYALIFHDLFGDISRRPIEFIPTGADDLLIASAKASPPPAAASAEPYLVFAGEVMPDYGVQVFQYLAAVRAGTGARFSVKVIGHELINRQRLHRLLDDTGLHEGVEFIDHLPQAQLYRYILGAKAAILAPGYTSHWWTNHAKLVDYVGLRKPVLAVVPDPSEARSVLMKTGLGVFLDGAAEQAKAKLAAFLNDEFAMPDPVAEECDRYLAGSQVASFVDIFDDLA